MSPSVEEEEKESAEQCQAVKWSINHSYQNYFVICHYTLPPPLDDSLVGGSGRGGCLLESCVALL